MALTTEQRVARLEEQVAKPAEGVRRLERLAAEVAESLGTRTG